MNKLKSFISCRKLVGGANTTIVLLNGDNDFLYMDPSHITGHADGDAFIINSKSNIPILDKEYDDASEWLVNNPLINEGFILSLDGKCKRIDKLTLRGMAAL